jgi:hypothetical protein
LRLDDAIEIDVVSQFALFDGRKTHEVEVTTQGIRYSIIFYCSSGYEGASNERMAESISNPWSMHAQPWLGSIGKPLSWRRMQSYHGLA